MDKMKLVKILWDYMHLNQKVEKCDCILGLGCHDLSIPVYCAELYKQKYGEIIIFAGGFGKITKDNWKISEAEKFAEIAIQLGVPREKIYIENKSANTGDNFRFTAELIEKNSLIIDSFLIVQKPYMERRSFAAFNAIITNKKCIVTSPSISLEDYFTIYENNSDISIEEIINVIVGDLQRIKVYAEYGWQIPQDIPKHVWDAYEKLVTLGYNKYVIKEEK